MKLMGTKVNPISDKITLSQEGDSWKLLYIE